VHDEVGTDRVDGPRQEEAAEEGEDLGPLPDHGVLHRGVVEQHERDVAVERA
jgi:hypothetical protein